jgi:WD40 repeat protein
LVIVAAGEIAVQFRAAAAQTALDCPGAPVTRLEVGQWAQVTSGFPNNVRVQPNLQNKIVGQLPGTALVKILSGPECVDRMLWWLVDSEGSALRGWTSEGSGITYYLEPLDKQESATYRELTRLGRGTIETIAWRPDGQALLVGGSRGISYYTDSLDLIGYWDKLPDREKVSSLAWHPDNRQFASAGGIYGYDWADGTLRIWDSFTGSPTQTLLGDTPSGKGPAITGERVIGWGWGGTQILGVNVEMRSPIQMHLWDIASGQMLLRVPDQESPNWNYGSLISAAWSPDRLRVLISRCGPDYGGAHVVSSTDGAVLTTLVSTDPYRCLYPYINAQWNPLQVGWSPDSGQVAITVRNIDTQQYALQIWSSITGELLRTIEVPVNALSEPNHSPDPMWVTWSRDGQYITSVNVDGTIRTWDVVSGELILTTQLNGLDTPLRVVAWNPTQNRLATSDTRFRLQVWDANTGELLATRLEHAGNVMVFGRWSPDGSHIATVTYLASYWVGDETQIHLWNAETGEAEMVLDSDTRRSVFWSADGRRVFTGVEKASHYVWDAQTGAFLGEFERTEDLWSFLDEPVDSQMISPGYLFYLRNDQAMSAVGQEKIQEFGANEDYYDPFMTVLSPNQDRLAIVPHHYSPQVWVFDLATSERLFEYAHHAYGFEVCPVSWLDWSPDGERLLSIGLDGTARIWGVPVLTPKD